MKNILLTSIFLLFIIHSYAQKYDLLVTAEKDSLACHIDSITDSYIYVEMLHNDNWIHTMFKKENIFEYKKDYVDKKKFDFKNGTSYIKTTPLIKAYQHAHKLMFAPTSYSLKQGEFYYNTHYGLIHSLQYGFTDNISLDFGTTLLAVPAYSMLNVSFPVSDNLAVTIGDLIIFDTWLGEGYMGNLAYGLFSLGNLEKQINLGVGYLNLSNAITKKTNTLALTVSGQIKVGKNAYFLTEHYGSIINNEFFPDIENYATLPEYIHKILFIGGMTGIRLKGKKNPRIAWQFGLAHIFLIDDNVIPEYYDEPERDNHLKDGRVMVRGLPMISFSSKFGKK